MKNDYANALKGTVSGEVVRVDDVSPVEHTVKVKISGDIDPSTVKVSRYGKNLIPYPYTIFTNSNEEEITAVVREDGGILLNGTTTKTTYINISDRYLYKFNIDPFSSSNGFIANKYNENIWVAYDCTNRKTFVSIKVGTICENVLFSRSL